METVSVAWRLAVGGRVGTMQSPSAMPQQVPFGVSSALGTVR